MSERSSCVEGEAPVTNKSKYFLPKPIEPTEKVEPYLSSKSRGQSCVQASGPKRHRQVSGRGRPAPCASSAVSMDTACNTLTVATAITW